MSISKHKKFMHGMVIVMLDCLYFSIVYLHGAADIYVVLAERKLTSYVYAVGKQPISNA